jgi:hypothetical protein
MKAPAVRVTAYGPDGENNRRVLADLIDDPAPEAADQCVAHFSGVYRRSSREGLRKALSPPDYRAKVVLELAPISESPGLNVSRASSA